MKTKQPTLDSLRRAVNQSGLGVSYLWERSREELGVILRRRPPEQQAEILENAMARDRAKKKPKVPGAFKATGTKMQRVEATERHRVYTTTRLLTALKAAETLLTALREEKTTWTSDQQAVLEQTRQAISHASDQEVKTIWNSDGTDGPVLICPPPACSCALSWAV